MGLQQYIGKLMLKAAQSALPIDPNAGTSLGSQVDWLLNRSGRYDHTQTPEQLLRKYHGWVYACASIGAASLAALPLKLYASRGTGEEKARCRTKSIDRQTDKRLRTRFSHKAEVSHAEELEEITEHPILDLLKHVNPNDNAFDLKEKTSLFLDMAGNSLWYLKLNTFGQPEEIWPLQPNLITLVRDPTKGVTGYLYGRQGDRTQQIKLSLDEVIHFKYPSTLDPWWGMGPVQAGVMAVSRQDGMDVYENSTLKNMGRPDIAVIYKGGQLQEDDRRELEISWNNAYSGPDKAGKVKVMDEQYEVKEFGWSPREMAFLQGRNWTLKEIAAMFPVPIALLDTEQISRAPRSGMDGTAMFMGMYNTLPRARRIEEKLNERLCPLYDERLFLAFDNPVPEDVASELQADTALLNTFAITINEVRMRRGLEPVEWGEKPWAPMGLQPIGTPMPEQPSMYGEGNNPFSPLGAAAEPGSRAPKLQEEPEKAPSPTPIAETGGLPGGVLSVKLLEGNKATPSQLRPVLDHSSYDKACSMLIKGVRLNGQLPFLIEFKAKIGHVSPLSKSEKQFRNAMNDVFTRQAAEARGNVEKFVKSGGTILNKKNWIKETNEMTLPLRWHPFKAGGDTALSAIHFDLPEWIESKQVLDAIRNENFMFAREISNGTADRLQAELLEGMDNGETISELKKRLMDIDEEWADGGRAEMIART